MRNKFLTVLTCLFCTLCFSQKEITWNDLANVTYTEKYFKHYDGYFMYPEFSNDLHALEGEQVTLKGYFLSMDEEQHLYILSKGPMASCYFCGQGGPETAVELQFKNKEKFKTDDIVAITGTLKLNKDDVEHFNYILTNCKGKIIK